MKAGADLEQGVAAAGVSRSHHNPPLLYTLVGLMTLFWSANFFIGKIALREFPGPLAASLRLLIAALGMLPIYFWKTGGQRRWSWRDAPTLVFLGFVGVAINQFCFIVGLSKTSVAHSSLIIGMTPIWVLLIAVARGLERMTPQKLGGMLIAFAGVAVLSMEKPPAGSPPGDGPTLAGDLITFVGASAFAFYTVLGKEVNHRFGSVTVNTFLFGSGALILSPVMLLQGWSFPFARVSAAGWLSLLYMGIFPSLVCYLIFYYALGYVAASRLSALSYLQPVAATALAAVFLGERISALLLAGGAVIFTGVYLTERGRC
ncbi:MAG TPA: DMT family transporter [Bryobacterales bacterium]|nr:DMT family transporter [Bryobacterales bacterium]